MTTEQLQPPAMPNAGGIKHKGLREEHLRRLACPSAAQLASSDSSADSAGMRQSPLSSEGAPSSASVLDAPKSAKRKAAEDLLAARFLARVASASSLLAAASPGAAAKRQRTDGSAGGGLVALATRPPVAVPACSRAACCSDGDSPWCGEAVSIPPMDWAAALHPVLCDADLSMDSTGLYHLPGGIAVRIVTQEKQLGAALRALRASMGDSVCAIDLEWRPDGYGGGGGGGGGAAGTRVALMQLASATMCVLIRTCRLPTPPPALVAFLSDPAITLVGYSWDGSDQAKLSATYGFGRERFARFHDLQQVSESLGYHGYGLGALTQQVLGFELPKNRKVTMSNWEAWQLSCRQIQYAALDAVVTGHVFRALRHWHASPSACSSCRHALGKVLDRPQWCCRSCQRGFESLSAAQSHARSKGHAPGWAQCGECGRAAAK